MIDDAKPPEGKHSCACKHARDSAGEVGYELIDLDDKGEPIWKEFIYPDPPRDCAVCDNTGWCY